MQGARAAAKTGRRASRLRRPGWSSVEGCGWVCSYLTPRHDSCLARVPEILFQVRVQLARRRLCRDVSDVVVRSQQHGEGAVRAEGFRRLRAELHGLKVKEVGVAVFGLHLRSLNRASTVVEGEQVKLRLAQTVVDALAINQKVGHAVAGLNFKTAV